MEAYVLLYIAIVFASLVALLFIARQKIEIFVLLLYYAAGVLMSVAINPINYNHYYVTMGTVSLAVGYIISYEFKVAAICSYLLVPINITGYLMWYKYYPHDLYNVIAAILLIIQFLSILPKALFNGLGRTSNRYSLDGGAGFNGGEEYDTMHKRPTAEETKCAKK